MKTAGLTAILSLWMIVPSVLAQPICDTGGPYWGCLGNCPWPVFFDGSGSSSPSGEIVSCVWAFACQEFVRVRNPTPVAATTWGRIKSAYRTDGRSR